MKIRMKSAFLHRVWLNRQGVALIEFALVLPIVLVILLGGIEITRLVLFHQKIDNATSAVADLITQLDSEEISCNSSSGLGWIQDNMLRDALSPYDWEANGQMVVSAIQAERDPADPNNDELLQYVLWQWSDGGAVSRIGNDGADVRSSAEWPAPFKLLPEDGGMFNGDRIVAVEVFYDYQTLLPATDVFLDLDSTGVVYKKAFYRSRFGKASSLADDCV